jgi:hypothetical protein
MNRRARASAATVIVAVGIGAAMATGGSGGASRCGPPPDRPETLSGPDRRSPAVASDGAAALDVVWESGIGGPIEHRARRDGRWSAPSALSLPRGHAPAIAMNPTGAAAVVWERSISRSTTAIQITTREALTDRWTAPVDLTPAARLAHEPQVAVDGRGTVVVVWRRDTTGDEASVVEVAERPPGGTWTAPHALSDPARRATRPRIAVSVGGAAIVTWQQSGDGGQTVMAAGRTPEGTWEPAARVSGAADGRLAAVAIGPTGVATVVWLGDRSPAAFAATRPDRGTWSAPFAIDRASRGPRPAPGIGRTQIGPDVAVMPDGRSAAVWLRGEGRHNRVGYSATLPDGTWTPPTVLSAGGADAGGVQIVGLAGGSALVAWDEIDAGLLRSRVTRLDTDSATGACTDLTAARTETTGVRLVGGAAPTAVFVELGRNRVQTVPVR